MYILFTHVIFECDTTSHVYGIGKPQAVKMIEHEDNVEVAKVFSLQIISKRR